MLKKEPPALHLDDPAIDIDHLPAGVTLFDLLLPNGTPLGEATLADLAEAIRIHRQNIKKLEG